MLKISQKKPARLLASPFTKVIAGLGTAFLLADPSSALAQSRDCTVTLNVDSATSLGALQLDVNYTGASDVGSFETTPDCTVAPTGLAEVFDDTGAKILSVGWANTPGFTGPALFATCHFILPSAASVAPVSADFSVAVTDASDQVIPPGTASPTVSVAVASCADTASACGNGLLESGEECDDGNLDGGDGCGPTCANTGSCAAAPLPGCKVSVDPTKSKLSFKNDTKTPSSNVKDQGAYSWKSGAATDVAEFKNPVAITSTYSWCVYDNGVVVRGSDIPGGAGWAASGTTGFGFKGDVDGVAQIKMKAGDDGKASISIKAKSKLGTFAAPGLPLTTPVVSQFVIDDSMVTSCFTTSLGTAKKNDAASYSAAGQ